MLRSVFDIDASNRRSSQNWFDFMFFMVGCDEIEVQRNFGDLFWSARPRWLGGIVLWGQWMSPQDNGQKWGCPVGTVIVPTGQSWKSPPKNVSFRTFAPPFTRRRPKLTESTQFCELSSLSAIWRLVGARSVEVICDFVCGGAFGMVCGRSGFL